MNLHVRLLVGQFVGLSLTISKKAGSETYMLLSVHLFMNGRSYKQVLRSEKKCVINIQISVEKVLQSVIQSKAT